MHWTHRSRHTYTLLVLTCAQIQFKEVFYELKSNLPMLTLFFNWYIIHVARWKVTSATKLTHYRIVESKQVITNISLLKISTSAVKQMSTNRLIPKIISPLNCWKTTLKTTQLGKEILVNTNVEILKVDKRCLSRTYFFKEFRSLSVLRSISDYAYIYTFEMAAFKENTNLQPAYPTVYQNIFV